MNTTTHSTTRIPAVSAEAEGTTLTLTFANGEKLTISTEDLTPEIRTQAMLHGLKQKLVDAAAIARNTDTGQSASHADKQAAVMAVHARLMAGEWNKRAEAGAEGTGKGSLLLLALARIQPTKTVEEVETWLAARSKEEVAALRKNASVVRVTGEIRAERAAKTAAAGGVDANALLDSLGAD